MSSLFSSWNRHKPILVGLAFILGLMVCLFSWNRSDFFGPDGIYYFGRFLSGWQDVLRAFTSIDDRSHYRPLGMVIFTFVFFPLFGYNAWWHHVAPLVFHAANTVLAYLIARRLLGSRMAGLASAFVFALHRINFFVTYGITFIPDFTGTFFFLAAFLAYLKSRQHPRWLVLAYAFWIASLFSKEAAVVLPAILTGYQFISSKEPSLMRRFGKSAKQTALFWVLAGVFMAWIFLLRGGALYPDSASHPYHASLSVHSAFAKAKYLWWGLNLPQGTGVAQSIIPGMAGVTEPISLAYPRLATAAALLMFPLVLAFLALVARSLLRFDNAALVGVLWFFMALTPVLPLTGKVMQHNLYIPLLGVALLAGVFVRQLIKSRWRFFLPAAMAVFLFSTFVGVVNNRVNSWPVTSSRATVRLLHQFNAAIPERFDCRIPVLVSASEDKHLIWHTDSGNLFKVFGPCRDLRIYFEAPGVTLDSRQAVRVQLQ